MNGQAKTAAGSGRHVAFDALVLRHPFSGVENAVAEQAETLLQEDESHRFTVFWPRSLRLPAPPVAASAHTVLRCGPLWSSRALRLLWEQCILPQRLRQHGVELLHAPAYLAPLACPCPFVLTVYDLHALDHPERCRPLNRWNFRHLLPNAIRRAHRIIVPSDHTRDAVARRFPAVADRIRIIPLGVHRRFHPRPSAPIATSPLPSLPQRYLLCVGNVEPRKNLPRVVEALHLLRSHGLGDLGLVIVGHVTVGDPAVEEAVRRWGLGNAVVRLGYVPDHQLPALYAGAQALVYASLAEGFGLPPLEAMACGCPVLCSDAAALRQTTGTAALHFAPNSAEALATAALALLSSPEHRRTLVAHALTHAARYQWPELIARVVAVYDEILSAMSPGGAHC